MNHVTIGLIGLGTVGTGVARLLTEHAGRIAHRAGRPIRWKWAAVRDASKPRDVRLDGVRLTTEVGQLIEDPEVDVIIETMGGTEPALQYVLASLAAGKHVVTANKALLAEHGAKIFDQARSARRAVAFEGSVGGGIPIVQALGFALAANQIQSLAAIVNGTCNFILTRMTSDACPTKKLCVRPSSLAMRRPTRPSTSTAPTRPTSWRSSLNWRSSPTSGSTRSRDRGSTASSRPT